MRDIGAVGLIVGLLVIALASGCSSKDRKKVDYDSTRTLPPLEIPPGLSTLPQSPSVQSKPATYSEFETQQQSSKGQFAALLPEFGNVALERAGAQRWLVVKAEADKLWPQMRDFIDSVGLEVAKERPEAGILETGWAENKVNISSGVQAFLNKIGGAGGGAGSGLMDKYRIRLERGEVPGTTEVYLSHQGMQQWVLTAGLTPNAPNKERDVFFRWKPRPSDPELEAEMLRLLMLHIGVKAPQAVAVLAAEPPPAQAIMGRNESGLPALNVFDSQERAWRRVGLSLDRIGFTVDDRDRSRWTYHIRYVTPQEGKKKKKKQKNTEEEYQVALKPVENGTAIEVFDQDGAPTAAKTSEQILSLLYEQLK